MPLLPLIAIFTAFWFHPEDPAPLDRAERAQKLLEVLGLIALVPIVSGSLGRAVVLQVARGGSGIPAARRLYVWGTRIVDLLVLGGFGWMIHGAGWPRV